MSRATISSSTAGASAGPGERTRMAGNLTRSPRADAQLERYDPGMVRHTRIVAATAAALAGLFSGALAPAAGDQRVTGSSAPHVRYTADGIPYVDFGPECK